jgi:hypothetical protein
MAEAIFIHLFQILCRMRTLVLPLNNNKLIGTIFMLNNSKHIPIKLILASKGLTSQRLRKTAKQPSFLQTNIKMLDLDKSQTIKLKMNRAS